MHFPCKVFKPLKQEPRTAQPFPTHESFRLTAIQKPGYLTEILDTIIWSCNVFPETQAVKKIAQNFNQDVQMNSLSE